MLVGNDKISHKKETSDTAVLMSPFFREVEGTMSLAKREALPIVFQCAKQYQKELVNHSLLFICMGKHNAPELTFDVDGGCKQ